MALALGPSLCRQVACLGLEVPVDRFSNSAAGHQLSWLRDHTDLGGP